MFKKLFSLFNDGKKCEEKKEIHYRDRVKVISGFYAGTKGNVIGSPVPNRYIVRIHDFKCEVFTSEELEKV